MLKSQNEPIEFTGIEVPCDLIHLAVAWSDVYKKTNLQKSRARTYIDWKLLNLPRSSFATLFFIAIMNRRCNLILFSTVFSTLLFFTGLPEACGIQQDFVEQQEETTWDLNFTKNEQLPPVFRQLELERKDKSKLTVYLGDFNNSLSQKKPLLIYIEGSGAQSHFFKMEQGIAFTTYGLIAKNYGNSHHVTTMEKRGVPFGYRGNRGTGEGASDEYNKHATLANRVADVRLTLDAFLNQPTVDTSQVILLGHSEGADVAAAVAAVDDRVTHVAFLSGGGAPQFYDFFVQTRKSLAKEALSPKEIEDRIASLEKQIREILDDPNNDKKFFAGHSFNRWSTFATVAAAENLVKTKAKLFLGHGTEDQSVPIESFDYLVVELLRHGKTDVTTKRYVGCDHSFIKVGEEPSNDPFQKVIAEVLDWAKASTPAK